MAPSHHCVRLSRTATFLQDRAILTPTKNATLGISNLFDNGTGTITGRSSRSLSRSLGHKRRGSKPSFFSKNSNVSPNSRLLLLFFCTTPTPTPLFLTLTGWRHVLRTQIVYSRHIIPSLFFSQK